MEDRPQQEQAVESVEDRTGLRRYVLSAAFLSLMVAELAWLLAGLQWAQFAGRAIAIAFLLFELRLAFARFRQAFLMVLAIGFSAWIMLAHGDPGATLAKALDQATYLMAFILLIGLLREGAQTSPAVVACGSYLTHQPPGRRYVSLHGGSHLLSVLINFGSISLLAPLVQRGVRAQLELGDALSDIWRVRERRQLCALYRGMAWVIAWAPTTITQAILPTVIPGIDAGRMVALGLLVAAITLALGWLEDRLRWWPLRRRLLARGEMQTLERPAFPVTAYRDFALVCLSLIALVIGIREVAEVPTVPALMLSCPIILIAWLLAQNREAGASVAFERTRRRLGDIAGRSIPDFSIEVLTLGLAGYVGVAMAAIVPIDQVAEMLEQSPLPAWAFLVAIPTLMLAASQIGLTSITIGVIFGTVLGSLPVLPADPTLVALALSSGWALSMIGSPFSAICLLLARITGYSTGVIAHRWNLVYSLLSLLSFGVLFYVLAG